MSNKFKCYVSHVNDITIKRYYSDVPVEYNEFLEYIKKQIYEIDVEINNLSLSYVNNCGNTSWLSLPFKKISKYGVKKILEQFDPNDVFYGSDNAEFVLEHYVLNTKVFKILFQPVVGGAQFINLNYYQCIDLTSDDNNCLLECFKYYAKSSEHCNVIRSNLGLDRNTMLSILHAKMLEKYFHINVSIYDDKLDIIFEYVNSKDPSKCLAIIKSHNPVVLYGDTLNKNKIVYNNNHYSVYKNNINPRLCHCHQTGKFIGNGKKLSDKQIIDELYKQNRLHDDSSVKSESQKDTFFYFFDYETVYNPITFDLFPYCFAIVKCDNYGNILKEWFSFNCNDMENILTLEAPNNNEIKYLIGYNNSRFDNFILLKLFGYDDLKDMKFAGNTILSGKVKGFILKDLCRFLNMSLKNACQSFKCNLQKEVLNHHDVQSAYTSNNWDEYLNKNKSIIQSYVLMDCKALSELWFKAENAFYNIIGENLRDHKTTAGMSYSIFKKTFKDNLPIVQGTHQSLIRKAVYGGRSQMFQIGDFKIPLCSIDCVSLYPYVMLENVYPVGDLNDSLDDNNIGISNISILHQPEIKVIPKREETLNWSCNYIDECYVSSVDKDCLINNSSIINIHNNMGWKKMKSNIFKQYFKPIVNEKIRQDKLKQENNKDYNHTLRESCKLLMNALSGKLIQKEHTKIIKIIKNSKELKAFKQNIKYNTIQYYELDNKYIVASGQLINTKVTMPTIWGVLIYSYARSHMYNKILNKVDSSHLFGMDTDSAFITVKQYHKLLNNYPEMFGDDFGQFKVETYDHYGIFVAPKCYCFYKIVDGNEHIVKWRFKGINLLRDKIIEDNSLLEKINNMSGESLHDLYFNKNKLHKITIATFRKLLHSKTYFLCSNLTKEIINKDSVLNIKQHFYIKEVTIKNNRLNEEILLN